MPVIEILANRSYPAARVRASLGAACRAVARAIGSKPGQVWVRFTPGRAEHYWEGDGRPLGREATPLLVFVTLARGWPEEVLRAVQRGLTRALARGLEVAPGAVWICIDEVEPTHVSQGGESYAALRGSCERNAGGRARASS
jgi:phenylpyruvate tautomerase PptA (4-oxalocrotonate tautomerase family)